MRRVIRLSLLALTILALSAQAALGARPVHDKFVEDATFEEELCGVPVTTHVHVKGNVLTFEDRFVDLSLVRVTWTNDAGEWVRLFIAGPVAVTEEWNGDILTVTEHHRGLHHQLRSSEGIHRMTFDRGQIVFRFVVDFTDPEDPVLISDEILFEAGPHPLIHSETDVFCDVIRGVLG